MSLPSNTEKTQGDSMDNDSGHDSVDSLHTPVDERERIDHLASAVAWIRQEVTVLKDYDRDILKELWKVRTGIHELREGHKEALNEEKKYLEDSSSERSASTASLKRSSVEPPSLSPSPDSATEANSSRFSTLDLKPPIHLQKEADDHVLESFFGTAQVDKLNKFKKSISVENPTADHESSSEELNKRLVRPKIPLNPNPGYSSGPSSRPGSGKGSKSSSPLLLPSPAVINPKLQPLNERKKETVHDVVSEMQKLRLRLQETTRQELAEMDRQFSPKLSRLDLLGSNMTGQGSHSRQGSLDSSSQPAPAPQPTSMGHVRHVSLPVDPSFLPNDVTNFSRPTTSSTSPSPLISSDASEKLKPHTDSHSLERSRSPSSRSPTPPFQYGHVRQGSVGSASSGSIGFSPPPTTGLMSPTRYQFPPLPVQRQQQSSPEMQQGSGRTISPRPFTTPPPNRTHQVRQQPQHYSYKQPHSTTSGKPPVPTPLNKGYNIGISAPQLNPPVTHPQQQSHHRKTSGSHTTGRVPHDGESQPKSDHHHTSTGGRMRPGSTGKTHYSTAVVRGRRHSGDGTRLPQARSVDDISKHLKEQQQVVRNGYPQTAIDSPAYDRLLPASGDSRGVSTSPTDVDQPEQKRVPAMHRMALPPGSKGDTHRSPSPRQLPRGETLPSIPHNSNQYARLEPKVSAPNLLGNENSATVFPEEIQPYTTSGELRSQMQPFVYTPFTHQERRYGSTSNSSGSKLDKHKPLKPTEQTWC